MKVCPHCQKTYEDDTLNFCLEDGTVLTQANSSFDNQSETVLIQKPQQTAYNRPPEPTLAAWQNNRIDQPVAKKGSKSWLWVLGILFGVAVLCGGGGLVGLAIIGSMDEEANVATKRSTNVENNENTASKDSRKLELTSDFSNWKFDSDNFIQTKYKNKRLTLTAKKGYYYVFLLNTFKTYNASIKLSLKNTNGEKTALGYGLVVNSDPKEVLNEDYAFLINSNSGEYRIVKHTNKKETEIVKWTKSNAIKPGTFNNDIEVRNFDETLKFYINGQYIRSVDDVKSSRTDVAGIYTSDDVPIDFITIELRK